MGMSLQLDEFQALLLHRVLADFDGALADVALQLSESGTAAERVDAREHLNMQVLLQEISKLRRLTH